MYDRDELDHLKHQLAQISLSSKNNMLKHRYIGLQEHSPSYQPLELGIYRRKNSHTRVKKSLTSLGSIRDEHDVALQTMGT